ncbi:MAG: hypothetical protein MPW15_17540 [Candidatus Manganitrophus sp.]|nr:hypothetical protein [Candidatus Manganitrophus sp.]
MKKNPLSVYRQKRNFDKTPEPSGVRTATPLPSQEEIVSRFKNTMRGGSITISVWRWRASSNRGPFRRDFPSRSRSGVWRFERKIIRSTTSTSRGSFRKEITAQGRSFLWEIGTYRIVSGDLEKGKLKFVVSGRRHHGRYTLVRTNRKGEKEDWLIMKTGSPLPEGNDPLPSLFVPMRAALGDKSFSDPEWVFEEKWDGVRAMARLVRDGEDRSGSIFGEETSPDSKRSTRR